MEKLEKTAQKVLIRKPTQEDRKYKGLQLIEERIYMGGTSIKYWM